MRRLAPLLSSLLLTAALAACSKGPPSFADVERGKIAMTDSQVEAIGQLLESAGVEASAFGAVERPNHLRQGQNGVEIQRGRAVALVLNGTKLARMDPVGALRALEVLDLRENALTRVDGLDDHTFLKQLHLDGNDLTSLGELTGLLGLRELTVSRNRLKSLDGLRAAAPSLEHLDASENALTDCPTRDGLYSLALDGNPCAGAAP